MLVGDLNYAQAMAKNLSHAYSVRHEEFMRKSRMDLIGDIIELYFKWNFPEAYEASRAREAAEELTLDDFSADSMDEMIEKMRAAAGML